MVDNSRQVHHVSYNLALVLVLEPIDFFYFRNRIYELPRTLGSRCAANNQSVDRILTMGKAFLQVLRSVQQWNISGEKIDSGI